MEVKIVCLSVGVLDYGINEVVSPGNVVVTIAYSDDFDKMCIQS